MEIGAYILVSVIVLQYAKDAPYVTRPLTVLKTRATRHDHAVRGFEITAEGLTLADTQAST